MPELTDFRVAVIATDGFEESELTEPVKALRDAGADVMIVAPRRGEIQGFKHHAKSNTIEVDVLLQVVHADEFDGVVLPGGALNADALRIVPEMQTFLQEMNSAGKPIAAICHAPWDLISAGLVKGRTLTSYHTIKDDIRNAGGEWVDQETVVDDNWITSRQPDDLPAFNRGVVGLFMRSLAAARH
jgi:protease I